MKDLTEYIMSEFRKEAINESAEFKIGDEVVISSNGKENDSYEDYFDDVLIITHKEKDSEGIGDGYIYSFDLRDGGEFPFSLYTYEFENYFGESTKLNDDTEEFLDITTNDEFFYNIGLECKKNKDDFKECFEPYRNEIENQYCDFGNIQWDLVTEYFEE